jgi:hypothetical protein
VGNLVLRCEFGNVSAPNHNNIRYHICEIEASALALALAGVAMGIGGALAVTGVMKGLLFHVSATHNRSDGRAANWISPGDDLPLELVARILVSAQDSSRRLPFT